MASQKDLPVVTEKCYLVDEHFNCTAIDHHVKGIYSYPEAFVVDANFCEDNWLINFPFSHGHALTHNFMTRSPKLWVIVKPPLRL